MPSGDGEGQLAIVPWDWLVAVVSERDAFRVEDIGWRGWHAELTQYWAQLRASASQPPAAPPQQGAKP